jgi:cob(I)alamin adenosyltransferase
MKGYVQVYTGNGKGKTTAALGLALRATGAGLKVFFIQFMKGMESSEQVALEKLGDLITLKRYGAPSFIMDVPSQEDIASAYEGLAEAKQAMLSGKYQVIVLDEANVAVQYNLFSVEILLDLMRAKPDDVELIITGRNAHQMIIEAADLVTEMKEIKHYYQKGIPARIGIEK